MRIGRGVRMDTAISMALVAALVVGLSAAKDVLILWIRARYRWQNGHDVDDHSGSVA
jgi:hypothetical protein